MAIFANVPLVPWASHQGLYSLSGKTSYHQISWSLEAARLGVIIIAPLWNLTGTSAALLPRGLSNIRAIANLATRDFTRSCSKTSYRLVNWGPDTLQVAGCTCAGNTGNIFHTTDFKGKPLASDPGMHHGKCVTHLPWCMSGSLTHGCGENVPGIPGACTTRNFTYILQEANDNTIAWLCIPPNAEFWSAFVVSLNKPLNSCRIFERPWCSCNVTLICNARFDTLLEAEHFRVKLHV